MGRRGRDPLGGQEWAAGHRDSDWACVVPSGTKVSFLLPCPQLRMDRHPGAAAGREGGCDTQNGLVSCGAFGLVQEELASAA